METKTKKMIVIGTVTFIALAIVALAISLPIALKNRDDASNNSSKNANTTNSWSGLGNETTVATTNKPTQMPETTTPEAVAFPDDPMKHIGGGGSLIDSILLPFRFDQPSRQSAIHLADKRDVTGSDRNHRKNNV